MGLFHLKCIHPLWKVQERSYTEGVLSWIHSPHSQQFLPHAFFWGFFFSFLRVWALGWEIDNKMLLLEWHCSTSWKMLTLRAFHAYATGFHGCLQQMICLRCSSWAVALRMSRNTVGPTLTVFSVNPALFLSDLAHWQLHPKYLHPLYHLSLTCCPEGVWILRNKPIHLKTPLPIKYFL